MTSRRKMTLVLFSALLLAPWAAYGQASGQSGNPPAASADQGQTANHGMVEFGFRAVEGDVYGRPDLPFSPNLQHSKYNEYRDLRNGFFVRNFRLHLDDVLGSRNYVSLQSQRAIYRDQSYLATFGRYGKFKAQFRYDEIPHRYSSTSRTLYSETTPGVFTIAPYIRANLQAIAASTSLPSTIQNQIVPGELFYFPQILRRAGSFLGTYEVNPNWDFSLYFWREHQSGTRPIGQIFNSSPSASLSGGYGAEVPEPINYFNNLLSVGTEYGRNDWGVQLGYTGSFFENNLGVLTFDNPFRSTDCVAPNGCTNATQGPATGRVDLYPDNHAQYINFAAAKNLTKKVRLTASINPGWLRQNDSFLPYTTNSILAGQLGALPAGSLDGDKQTLSMYYTVVSRPLKNFEIKAAYRHYDYNNNTPVRTFTPVQGDASISGPEENTPFGYNRKNFQLIGNWFFAKKSSAKIGYEAEWMDRSMRDVSHSFENSIIAALDSTLRRNLNFRASYKHSDRKPDAYEDDTFTEISGGITEEQVNHRRFDEAARLRDRGNVQLSWDVTDRLSVSGFGDTTQDNYNRRGGTNSPAALNFLAGTTQPYYLYGVLKDISYDYGFDLDFALSPAATFFAEYSHERYHKRMTSRYRVPGNSATPTPFDCGNTAKGCDSANNDWESTTRDLVDIWTAGVDFYLGKKIYLTTYYDLSAAKGNVYSHPLGDPTITTGANKFLLTGTNAAVDYPETVSRTHEVVAVLKYKLTPNLMPRLEYRYQQFDNKDYQTSPMTPYMGCVSPLPPSAAVPGCPAVIIGAPSPYYPYFVVGDTSATRYLFLGVDQPSYRAHYFAATLEYHF